MKTHTFGRKLILTSMTALFALGLAGCPDDGPMEEAGEAVDDAADEVEDAFN